ncbi:MAG: prephenate dehydrogenase/arogenate dehydrogenase family protein [bacterium]|nr:prephenate dehydrogenase/arogenate dehydrogenase family protein [bacterium]
MGIKTVGIVGYGSFGTLAHVLFKRFAPSVEVRIFSPDKKPDNREFFTLADTAQCDAVILAVPIHAFEEVLSKVVPLAGKDSVIVDIATVKVHTVQLLKKLAKGHRYIATHPMWGPESYEKRAGDVKGFRIVMTDGTLEVDEYKALTAFLKQCGFEVVEMTPESHDKQIAETLFLTHLIGQTILHGGFGRRDIDTVSFGYLMDAVESVRRDEKLFRDVFTFNPYCKDVLARFKNAEENVRGMLEKRAEVSPTEGLKIGVSGAQGSFSQEAAEKYREDSKLKKCTLMYLISVENVLAALEAGTIDLGVFPIENSTGGVVTETVHALAKHNCNIKKLFDIDIHQNLLAREGANVGDIKTITSHEQALKQCRAYLLREWPDAKIEEYEDTAKAAEDLAAGKLPATTAVIASAAAAKLYKLKILEKSIQDLKTNYTTFLAASAL